MNFVERIIMKTGSHSSFVRTRTGYSIIICLALLCACLSCRDKKKAPAVKHAVVPGKADLSVEDFAQTLKPVLPVIDTADSTWIRQPLPASAAAMALVYQLNDYEPIWLNEDGVLAFADSLIAELDSLQWDGLPAARYQLPQLQELKAKALSHSASLPDLISFDTLCTRAYLMASRDLLLGVELPRKADTLWFHSNDSLWNGWRSLAALNQSRAYPSLSAYRSAWPAYELMRTANRHYAALAQDTVYQSLHAALRLNMPDSLLAALLQRQMPWLSTGASDSLSETKQLIQGFQYYFGQRVTAKLDTATYKKLQMSPDSVRQLIGLNLERMRWMNQSPGTDYIIVPIPLMELFLVHKDEPGMHMRVVVGKPSRQTPSLNANMANVVLNPPWGVPPTILKKDVAPGLAKSGGAYLARKGLRAFDAKGKVISAAQINGSNYRRFFYRQEPGARNALGEVKFNLPNKWDIYLHDTPHKEDFPNRNRAKSSGCIRVARPKDMAEYILSEMEGKKRFSPEYIDSVISTRKTRYELLQHKIPVHIVYLTAYPDSSAQALRLLDDVYGHDSRMLARTGTIAKKS